MTKFTVEDILALNPCKEYRDGTLLKRAFGRRKYMTVFQATDPTVQTVIPPADLVWFFTQPGVLPDQVRGLWIADCAERAVMRHWSPKYPTDTRPQAAIDAVRAYYRGEATRENLLAAWEAAWEAAGDAARAAGTAAARAAAWEAAWEAARAAEHRWQVARLREILEVGNNAEGGAE